MYLALGKDTTVINACETLLHTDAAWMVVHACCLTGLCSVTCSVFCVKVRDVSENPLAKPETTKHHSDDPQMETRILENSINKICSLLAVGFGDAGAEVIANNIRSGGDLNPMIPGNKVVAIFGFCDIRNFTDTTEVLQEDIMEFVNTIADIVHTEVSCDNFACLLLVYTIGCDTCITLVCAFSGRHVHVNVLQCLLQQWLSECM